VLEGIDVTVEVAVYCMHRPVCLVAVSLSELSTVTHAQ
jgi:hypothetical protein